MYECQSKPKIRINLESPDGNIFVESYEELLLNENIEVIQNKLIDYENSVNRIIDYYFGDVNIKFVFNDFRSLYDLNVSFVNLSLREIPSCLEKR